MENLIEVSTLLGRFAAICNHRNNQISRELGGMIESNSFSIRRIMSLYQCKLFNKDMDDCLERRRNDVVRKIAEQLSVEIPSELSVEIPSEIIPAIPESLDDGAFGDGFTCERKYLKDAAKRPPQRP